MNEHWRQSTWGDEISLEYGKAIRGYQDAPGPFKVFGSNGPIGRSEKALVQGPGVILGRKGAYRGVHFSSDPFFVIDTAYYVKPKTDLDMRWLFYAIIYHKLGEIDDGSPIPSTTRAAVYIQDVAIPPLDEQREIAAVLELLDDKIELNLRTAATLEEMARALYRSWFVDFDPVHANAAGLAPAHMDTPTAAIFPNCFGDDGLPAGWATGSLKDVTISIRNGGTPKRDTPDYWTGGTIPWLTSGEVRQSLICSTKNYISEAGLSGSSAKWVEAGAILVALYGATAGQVSRTAIRLTTNQAICAISAEADFQNYIYFVLKEQVESLADKAIGSAQQNISKKIVEDLEVLLPPRKLALKFQDITAPIFLRIENCWYENESLTSLRDTLLPLLMSGELPVGDARAQVEDAL